MTPPTLLVLADDLTGANDAGVQFASAGLRGIVLANPHLEALPDGFSFVVVNTETRHSPASEAAARVRRWVEAGLRAGVRCFYKKTDSTLRGNAGAGIEALLQAAGESSVAFVPALPELGRTTKGGIHFVHGTPIAETPFSRDPLNPIRHSAVTDVLRPQVTVPLSSISSEGIASGGAGIAVVDCESNEDLARIARELAAADRLRVVAGSVALARYLVTHLDLAPRPIAAPELFGPILLVNGSLNERALEQIAAAGPRFAKLKLAPEQLLGSKADLRVPGGGGHLLMCSVEQEADLDGFRKAASARGLSEHELHLRVAERTGQLVHALLAAGVYRTLVVFGGDTLAGIARANGWRSFVPVAELEPGISVSMPDRGGLTLISKAGGFGDGEVVGRLVRYVGGER